MQTARMKIPPATAAGRLRVLDLNPERAGIEISEDLLSAHLVIIPGNDSIVRTDPDCINVLLDEAGVRYGILSDIGKLIPEQITEPVEILVAKGLAPINGLDGSVKIVRPEDISAEGEIFRTDDNGNVNYRERLDTGIVRQGEVVAIVAAPTVNRDGITVTGESIPSSPGKPCNIALGKNVAFDESGETVCAECDGRLIVRENAVSIDEFLHINGNVDYNTGNITFDGPVHVKGDLLPGFYISAGGSVEICGAVDSGSIVSGGDIIVRGAIFGAGKTKIKAKGNIKIKFAEGASIVCDGNLTVGRFLRNCDAAVGGNVKVIDTRKGHILGGRLILGGNIETFDLGCVACTATTVQLGPNMRLQARHNECTVEIRRIRIQLIKIEPYIRNMNAERNVGKLNPEREKMTQSLFQACLALQRKLMALDNEKSEIEEKFGLGRCGTVTVKGKTYPGAGIRIGMATRVMKEEMARAVFSAAGEEIEIKSL